MDRTKAKQAQRSRRKRRVRKRVSGTAERPRMTVFRSHKNISVQLIDDGLGRTLCQAATANKDLASEIEYGGNIAAAKRVGEVVAQQATAQGITRVVFDRNGYKYHGRVRSLADAAREGGLTF